MKSIQWEAFRAAREEVDKSMSAYYLLVLNAFKAREQVPDPDKEQSTTM